jgi:hypothetical protein
MAAKSDWRSLAADHHHPSVARKQCQKRSSTRRRSTAPTQFATHREQSLNAAAGHIQAVCVLVKRIHQHARRKIIRQTYS